MKTIIKSAFIALCILFVANNIYAQLNRDDKKVVVNQTIKKDPTISNRSNSERDVEESLQKAADATERAAEKLKIIIEDKADKIARSSKPYVDNFLIATSNLIEKLAIEIEKMMDEKPVNRSPERK